LAHKQDIVVVEMKGPPVFEQKLKLDYIQLQKEKIKF
jgi:hypothetical protein